MFNGFPTLTPRLINSLELQGYINFVKQNYAQPLKQSVSGVKAILFSPFKEPDKAAYYWKRLKKSAEPGFFNVQDPQQKKLLVNIIENPASVCVAKIIEHNFKLDDELRNKIASYIKSNYPQPFDLMIKNNFRIVIGDNFGEVFYKIRIRAGIIITIRDEALNN